MPTSSTVNGGPATVPARQTVDPSVTRTKFERELARFKELERHYQERGILLRRVEFPQLFFVFVAPLIRPAPVLFGVKFDFTNYDVEAISAEFVDPLTEAPLRMEQMFTPFPRQGQPVAMEVEQPGGQPQVQLVPGPPQTLLQAHAPHNIPFVCLPGVREYHEQAAHSNDSWQLRLSRGEGSLGFILDQFYQYGAAPIVAYMPNLVAVGVDDKGNQQVEMRGITFNFRLLP